MVSSSSTVGGKLKTVSQALSPAISDSDSIVVTQGGIGALERSSLRIALLGGTPHRSKDPANFAIYSAWLQSRYFTNESMSADAYIAIFPYGTLNIPKIRVSYLRKSRTREWVRGVTTSREWLRSNGTNVVINLPIQWMIRFAEAYPSVLANCIVTNQESLVPGAFRTWMKTAVRKSRGRVSVPWRMIVIPYPVKPSTNWRSPTILGHRPLMFMFLGQLRSLTKVKASRQAIYFALQKEFLSPAARAARIVGASPAWHRDVSFVYNNLNYRASNVFVDDNRTTTVHGVVERVDADAPPPAWAPTFPTGRLPYDMYQQLIRLSTFCFAPEGDARSSSRQFDVFVKNCIPVYVGCGPLPFQSNIPYDDFAIIVTREEVRANATALIHRLATMSGAEIERRQRGVARWRSTMLLRGTSLPPRFETHFSRLGTSRRVTERITTFADDAPTLDYIDMLAFEVHRCLHNNCTFVAPPF
jgi:hypothetical protein